MSAGNSDNKARTQARNFKEQMTMWRSPISTALSPAYLLKNYALGLVGYDLSDLIGTQMDTSIDAFHSPQARAQILRNNVEGIKTSHLNEHIKKANQSIRTNLEDVLTRTTTGFETLKASIEKLLPDPAAQEKLDLLTAMEDIAGNQGYASLRTTRALNDEMEQFKLRMEALQELLETNAVDNPRVITAYVKEQYAKLLEQLKLKKTADLNKIAENMRDLRRDGGPRFTNSEYAELEATLKKDINEVYEKAEKALDKDFKTGTPAEKKDGKDVDKGTPSLFSNLDKATKQAEAELLNFVLFAEKSKSKMLVESGLSGGLGAGSLNNGRIYRDISFDDYAQSLPERDSSWVSPTAWMQYAQFLMNNKGELTTPSGLRISHTDGGMQFSFPSGSSFYHHYQDRLLGADMMMMVNEIVRQGKDEITFVLTECSDPKLRKVLMEEFYYAAHLAGFPDDKIKFEISGCPRAKTEEEQKPIDNKTAAECMGMLGRAPKRAQLKKAQWDQDQAALDNTVYVKGLSDRIDDMINQNAPALQGLGRNNI